MHACRHHERDAMSMSMRLLLKQQHKLSAVLSKPMNVILRT